MTEDRLIAALLNATFQTIVLTLAVAIVLRVLRRTSASARCAVWTAALIIAIALPFIDYARVQSVEPTVAITHTTDATRAPVSAARSVAVSLPAVKVRDVPVVSVQAPRTPFASALLFIAGAIKDAAHVVYYAWIAGVAVFALRLTYQMFCLLNAKRAIEPMDAAALLRPARLRRSATLGLSDRVAVPCLLGFVRPVIAIPRVLAAELSGDDFRRIVLHEAAHLERCDDWFNLLEQVALVFLFFNPALHFIARRIGTEREIACDDRVIAVSHGRVTYAECLTELARRCSGHRALTVPGFFTNRRQILVRIEQLLDRGHNGSPQAGRKAVAAAGVVIAAGLLLTQLGVPVIAAGICPNARATLAAAALPALERFSETAWTPGALPLPAPPAPRPLAKLAHPSRPAKPAQIKVAPPARPANAPVPRAAAAPHAAPAPAAEAQSASSLAVGSSAAPVAAYAYAYSGSTAAAVAAPVARQDATYTDGPSLAGYTGLSVDQIIQLHDHGVDSRFVERMKAAGYSGLKPEDLIRLRDHSVSAAFAQAMNAMAGTRLDIDSLVRLRDHGVSTAYADSLAANGLRGIPIDQLIELRDHGVSAEYLASLAQAGYGKLSADQAIMLRDHGVTASYIQHIRKDLNPATLTIEELIRLRDSGI